MKDSLPKAKSITHEHILGVVLSELKNMGVVDDKEIRILDVGCGSGELIAYLKGSLHVLRQDLNLSFHGVDVVDYGVQAYGYQKKTIASLQAIHPDVDWESHIHFITYHESWPIDDGMVDFVLTNQVLEHVQDHYTFFSEQKRVLRVDGVAIHLFPLREIWGEGHVHLLYAHWINNWERLRRWIVLLSQLGFGKFKKSGMTLSQYAEGHADYINLYTNYITEAELLNISKRAGFRSSFCYTGSFYLRKIAQIINAKYAKETKTNVVLDNILFWILKRVSSITFYQKKSNKYQRFE